MATPKDVAREERQLKRHKAIVKEGVTQVFVERTRFHAFFFFSNAPLSCALRNRISTDLCTRSSLQHISLCCQEAYFACSICLRSGVPPLESRLLQDILAQSTSQHATTASTRSRTSSTFTDHTLKKPQNLRCSVPRIGRKTTVSRL